MKMEKVRFSPVYILITDFSKYFEENAVFPGNSDSPTIQKKFGASLRPPCTIPALFATAAPTRFPLA